MNGVGICENGYPLAHIPTDKMIHGIHHHTLQYCKVQWCGLYHLLVGICENGYPLAHFES